MIELKIDGKPVQCHKVEMRITNVEEGREIRLLAGSSDDGGQWLSLEVLRPDGKPSFTMESG